MNTNLTVYNSLSRKKEKFEAIKPPFVGLYLCGPTVYGDGHLGHARSAITFDLINRYLKSSGYKVRYVRNITDVGHLVNDADAGEDKIGKKAKLDELEPMEIVQQYTNSYHADMLALNCLNPNIEPTASGHIPEQIEMIEDLINKGYAYVSEGSVYFDVVKYNSEYAYGELSGRILEDLIAGAGEERRSLEGQEEKRNPVDFALWKKASPSHIMRWKSPWSDGFPGWHIECSAMSKKYLGEVFDIHGGGMDLLFPHHECEIAQSKACSTKTPAKYWLHNNMITINGQKMGKSLGNSITLKQFFNGDHPSLSRKYSPMVIRFFILQAHYRSTLDFSTEAMEASEKGLSRLLAGMATLMKLKAGDKSTFSVDTFINAANAAMNDDFNSPILIAELFEVVSKINSIKIGNEQLNEKDLLLLQNAFQKYVIEILGIENSNTAESNTDELMQMIIELRNEAKAKKDFATSDAIRDKLLKAGIQLKDGKEGTEWTKSN